MKLKELLDVFEVNGYNLGGKLHIFVINNNGEYGKNYIIKHANECNSKLLNKEVVSLNLNIGDLTIDIK